MGAKIYPFPIEEAKRIENCIGKIPGVYLILPLHSGETTEYWITLDENRSLCMIPEMNHHRFTLLMFDRSLETKQMVTHSASLTACAHWVNYYAQCLAVPEPARAQSR